jgi:geranylgeranyl reductase family protein
VGGGPSGAVVALSLGRAGHRVLLLDRDTFPRDKVCGDLQGRRASAVIAELGLMDEVRKLPLGAVRHHLFSAPDGTSFTVHETELPPGAPPHSWICRRAVFDDMLFQAARSAVDVREGFRVSKLLRDGEQVTGVVGHGPNSESEELRARLVVGADGYASVVAHELGAERPAPEHICIAARGYWRGVKGLSPTTETHFIRELLPGYLWIFALSEDEANVGLGMMVPATKERHVVVGKMLEHLVADNPLLAPRFADAELEGAIGTWSIPMGTHHRKLAWPGALLVGDAACLADPFTAEGVGNGMWSGWVAAAVAHDALTRGDLGVQALQPYADRVSAELGPTLERSAFLQSLTHHEKLLDRLAHRGAHSAHLRELVERMIEDESARKMLRNPLFFLEVLLGR